MDDDQIDLRGVFGLLRRKLWLIILVALLALAGAGVALLALKPVYTATALVLVDPSKKNLLDPQAEASSSSSDSARVDSEVELVSSETTLLSVIRDLNLVEDPEFGVRLGMRDMLMAFFRIAEPALPTGEEAFRSVLVRLGDAVSVERRSLTFLIAVEARSGSADKAALLANTLAQTYIRQQLQAKIDATLASRDIIQARIIDASATVAQSEQAFDTFIDANLDRISAETGRSDLAVLKQEIETLAQSRSQSAAVAELAEQGLARRDWTAVADALKNEAVRSLDRQRTQLVANLADAVEDLPAAINLQAELARIKSGIETAAGAAITTLRQDVATAQARTTNLRARLRTTILDSNLPADVLTSMYELQQSGEIARAQYQTLLTRQKDLDTQAYLQQPDSRVVSEATPPSSPSFPNPRLMLALAGVAGLAVGIGLAFLIENFVGGFTTEGQMQSLLRLPVAAAVPRQKPPKVPGGGRTSSVADAPILAPLSMYSESVRRIRIGLDQAAQRSPTAGPRKAGGRVAMVTSAAPNEGKTTLALSLARAYALSGRSTLLIDCDLRKPNVHRQLGLETSNGLLDFLSASAAATLDAITHVDAGSGAQVIVGSRRSDVATDQLIAGPAFERLIDAARANFDIVILDTPPVGPVVDGLYLASLADVVAFVVRWSSTPQQEVKAAVASLVAVAPTTPVLTVLNQVDSAKAGYRGSYAGYYSEA